MQQPNHARRRRYRPENRLIAKRAADVRGVRTWAAGTRLVNSVLRTLRRTAKDSGLPNITPEFVLETAGVENTGLDDLRQIARGEQEPTPKIYMLCAKLPRTAQLKEEWLAAVLVGVIEHLYDNPPRVRAGANQPEPPDPDELKAHVVEYVNELGMNAVEAPALGRPFIKGDRVYLQLEGRGGAGRWDKTAKATGLLWYLRDIKDSPIGQYKSPVRATLNAIGFVRSPFAYMHPERGNTSASYYSAPLTNLPGIVERTDAQTTPSSEGDSPEVSADHDDTPEYNPVIENGSTEANQPLDHASYS